MKVKRTREVTIKLELHDSDGAVLSGVNIDRWHSGISLKEILDAVNEAIDNIE